MFSSAERVELASFLGQSVTPGTLRKYQGGWETWTTFIQERPGSRDPYMKDMRSDEDKACLLAAFFKDRYAKGHRGKSATGPGASVRLYLKMALCPTDFCDSPIVSMSRRACRLRPDELRALQQGGGRQSQAKLPVWEGLLEGLRETMWENLSWEWGDIDKRMRYLCLMWGYDLAARGSEVTSAEGSAEDHAIKACQLIFRLREPMTVNGEVTYSIRGGSPTALQLEDHNVLMIEVEASSHKMGDLTGRRNKVIGRRGEEESQWCSDLVAWGKYSKVKSTDNWFTRYATQPGRRESRLVCTRKSVVAVLKKAVAAVGLDPDLFSFHSLRKASITHMSAMGVPQEQMLARGNYTTTSSVMGTVYDYNSAGVGPIGANSLGGGSRPGLEEVRRYIPAAHHT